MNELAARLRARRAELEAATLTRARAVSDPAAIEDPEYALGLQVAIATGLDYAISALESGEGAAAPVPDQLLGQARAAARHGVSLDTVLRRYSAGHTLLGDYLIEEAGSAGVPSDELKRAFRAQAAVYDRLVSVVSAEYAREATGRPRTAEQRRAELVKKVLAGDPADRGELRYPFECCHVGVLAAGPGSLEVLRETAGILDLQHLLVRVEPEVVWGWFGDQDRLSPQQILSHAKEDFTAELTLALGELGYGIEGWRLTHRQAKAAMSVVQRGPERHLRYADAALLASALRDDLLADSLHDIYLAPLESERDGGAALRRT
ncbi:MAG TPA: hypothetical protein VMR96_10885, partial [Solirubrobacterales bacterium]|nr:hypothetical protein [Solirubrobacterales bacterium]